MKSSLVNQLLWRNLTSFSRTLCPNSWNPFKHATTVLGLSDEKFTNESFLLQPVSQNLIFKQLKDLKVKKATGLDGISAQFLKDGVSVIAPTVTPLVNLSLSIGIVPCDWKMARVFPLYVGWT